MFKKLIHKLILIWKIKDLRNNILFVLGILIVFRVAANIPIAGVNVSALKDYFSNNQFLGLMNIFTGGGMSNFSVVMLGIGPYITASIIFQLLAMIIPSLEEMNKEESGREKINQYTRIVTVPLAMLQAYGMITLLQRTSKAQIIPDLNLWKYIIMIITVTGGTMFLVWLGELISEKKIGNGISIIIFAGIVAGIPAAIGRTIASTFNFETHTFEFSQMGGLLIFTAIALFTTAVIVYISEAQRNVPVSYAKVVRGNKMYGGMDTHLPLKVNQAGMIPIIFAISIIMFPPMIAQFLARSSHQSILWISNFTLDLFANHLFYGILYFLLVVAFTYFYTSIIFHPKQIAENLQKQGAFIPGIRPGRMTEEYLGNTVHKIVFTGALFLGGVAIVPLLVQIVVDVPGLTISGASLLIVVGVVLESMEQIDSQLTMRDYEGF